MNKLDISEIQIIPVRPRNGLVAFASCVINSSIYVGNIAIYTAPSSYSGYRLVYPNKTLPNGKDTNCVYPINRDTGEIMQSMIAGKYEEVMEKVGKSYEANNTSR